MDRVDRKRSDDRDTSRTDRLRTLSYGAVAAFAVFSVAWVALGAMSQGFVLFGTHVAPYNWVAQPVSGLGLGNTAVAMNTAFVLTGVLLATGVVGILAAVWDMSVSNPYGLTVALLLSPVGIVGCGVFTLEQFMPHFAGFLLAAGAPTVGFFLLGRRLRALAGYSALSRLLVAAGPITLVLLVLALWSFDPVASGQGLGVAGLTQRILITEVLGMFAIAGVLIGRKRSVDD